MKRHAIQKWIVLASICAIVILSAVMGSSLLLQSHWFQRYWYDRNWSQEELLAGVRIREAVIYGPPGEPVGTTLTCGSLHLLDSYHPIYAEVAEFCDPAQQASDDLNGEDDIRLYPEKLAHDVGADVTFRVAATGESKEIAVNGVQLTNVTHGWTQSLDHQSLLQVVQPDFCESFFGLGCNFDQSFTVSQSENLQPGFYRIELFGHTGEKGVSHFIVRDLESRSDLVLVVPDWTVHAYNTVGGGSLYRAVKDTIELEGVSDRHLRVSQMRPVQHHSEDWSTHVYETYAQFSSWLAKRGFSAQIVSMGDLHDGLVNLDESRNLILAGHNEYWSLEQVDAAFDFLKRGGDIINVSGNVMWWLVRPENNELFVYKLGIPEKKLNYLYINSGIADRYRSIVHLAGASYRQGGYSLKRLKHRFPEAPITPRHTGVVITCDHPITRTAGLDVGDLVGASSDFIHYEVDGRALDDADQFISDSPIDEGTRTRILGTTNVVSPLVEAGDQEDPSHRIAVFVENQVEGYEGRTVTIGSMGILGSVLNGDSKAAMLVESVIHYLKDDDYKAERGDVGCSWQ